MSTNFLSDTFTDVAGTLLDAHTGELGATWTKILVSPFAGTAEISDANALKTIGSGGLRGYLASGTPESPDYDVSVVAKVVSLRANDGPCALGRCGSAAGYLACYHHGTGYGLFRINGTALLQLGAWVAATITDGVTIMLRMRGSAISLLVDGVVTITVTDATFTSAGLAGVAMQFLTSDNTQGIHANSITATSFPVAAAGGSPLAGRWIQPMDMQPWNLP